MVTQPQPARARKRGSLMLELLVATGLLVGSLLPIAFSITWEKRLARAYYQRAVAMEIVDGEIEVLAAGAWRAFSNGSHPYPIRANAATNLPPSRFLLTVQPDKLRLQWLPDQKHQGGTVTREVPLQ